MEHKANGDRAKGDVEFRFGPMLTMTYGDMGAMGDYFESPDEMASLAGILGSGKGTRVRWPAVAFATGLRSPAT